MNRTRLKVLRKRIEALTPKQTVIIPQWIKGTYKLVVMDYSEARALCLQEMEVSI